MNGAIWKDTDRGKMLPPPLDWTWHNLKSSPALWFVTQSQYMKQMLLLSAEVLSSPYHVVAFLVNLTQFIHFYCKSFFFLISQR